MTALCLLSQFLPKPEHLRSFSTVYLYGDGVKWLAEGTALTKRLGKNCTVHACPTAAHRRSIAPNPEISWRSLPEQLEEWLRMQQKQGSVEFYSELDGLGFAQSVHFKDINENGALKLRLQQNSTLGLLEGCDLLLSALALDWSCTLFLERSALAALMNPNAREALRSFASLPLFGLSEAFAAGQIPEDNALLPIRALTEDDFFDQSQHGLIF